MSYLCFLYISKWVDKVLIWSRVDCIPFFFFVFLYSFHQFLHFSCWVPNQGTFELRVNSQTNLDHASGYSLVIPPILLYNSQYLFEYARRVPPPSSTWADLDISALSLFTIQDLTTFQTYYLVDFR